MSADLLCEWNIKSDDAQHQGSERCTDCLVVGRLPALATECDLEADQIKRHCPTCDCRPERDHSEGFVACDEHLPALIQRYHIPTVRR